jgi:hypothetical protein
MKQARYTMLYTVRHKVVQRNDAYRGEALSLVRGLGVKPYRVNIGGQCLRSFRSATVWHGWIRKNSAGTC